MGMMNWRVLMQAGSTLEKYPHNPQKPQSGMNSEDVEDVLVNLTLHPPLTVRGFARRSQPSDSPWNWEPQHQPMLP